MNKLHYIFSKYVVNTWEINGWIHGDHGQKTAIVLETFKFFFFLVTNNQWLFAYWWIFAGDAPPNI